MATDQLVDSHTHVACAGDQVKGRTLGLATTQWWEGGHGTEPELRQAFDDAGVARAVIVQAIGLYAFDCSCAARAVAESGGRYALVAGLDMTAPDPVADLEVLVKKTPMAGIRLYGLSPDGAPWLTDGRGDAVCDAVAELGLVAVPVVFGSALPALRTLAGDRPALTVALDHCGFPDLGPPEAMDDLMALSDVPGIHLKVSSHNLDTPADPAAFVEPLAAAFGPTRLCWGSDHPQHMSRTYPEMLELGRQAVRDFDPADRAAFLGANSLRLWWPATAGVEAPPGP